jgi:hypothetical protein
MVKERTPLSLLTRRKSSAIIAVVSGASCGGHYIYGWFTEGFDTPDLKSAKALLDELDAKIR